MSSQFAYLYKPETPTMEKDSLLYAFLKGEKDVEFHYEGGNAYPVDPFVPHQWLDEYLKWANTKFLPVNMP